MPYLGLQTQIWRNNLKSAVLLAAFPLLTVFLTWLFVFAYYHSETRAVSLKTVNETFLSTAPLVAGGIFLWFIIAYFSHSSMIRSATGSRPLTRQENPRIYNLVENLCISVGMTLPKINIIEDHSLNAFASGVDQGSYTVSLSRGIIDRLNDEELNSVIAHELTHIRNRDVRLLIISIVFVGIFALLTEIFLRTRVRSRKGGNNIVIIGMVLAPLGYLFATLFRLALSRKREFLADAGAAEMTRNPRALASALRKISTDSRIEAVERKDVAQLFIENPQEKTPHFFSFQRLFSTHPAIEERIKVLEGM